MNVQNYPFSDEFFVCQPLLLCFITLTVVCQTYGGIFLPSR